MIRHRFMTLTTRTYNNNGENKNFTPKLVLARFLLDSFFIFSTNLAYRKTVSTRVVVNEHTENIRTPKKKGNENTNKQTHTHTH